MIKLSLKIIPSLVINYIPNEFINENFFFKNHPDDQVLVEFETDISRNNSDEFYSDFQQLLDDHGLSEQSDNLLLIMVLNYHNEFNYLTSRKLELPKQRLAKVLAKLIIDLKTSDIEKVSFQYQNDEKKGNIIKEDVITNWIKTIILEAFENKNFPLGDFGFKFLNDMTSNSEKILDPEPIDIEKLKAFNNKRLISSEDKINKGIANVCFVMKRYLNDQSHLRDENPNGITNEQADFFYDLYSNVLKIQLHAQIFSAGYTKRIYIRSHLMNSR